jgi:mitochondrial chaperone BCS1
MVDVKRGSPWESVVLTTLSRDKAIFAQLLQEARQLAVDLKEGKTVIYTCWGLEWRQFGQPRRKRPLSSVILDQGVKERIVEDVKDFLAASKYYFERGINQFRLLTLQESHIAEDIFSMALLAVAKPASFKLLLVN